MYLRFSFFLIFFCLVGFISQAQEKKTPKKEPTTNLIVVKIAGDLPEYVSIEGFEGQQPSLHSVLEMLYKAKNDAEIHGMILEVGEPAFGRAKMAALMKALAEFKASGKPIYCYVESLSTNSYLLASQASRLSLYPTGDVFIPGVAMQMMFVKGLLEKIGIEADFITQGKYKSAAEMMTRNSSSTPAREANMAMLDDMYDGLVSAIATARKISPEKAKKVINSGILSAETAVEMGLIDHAEYSDEFEAAMKAAHTHPIKKITKYNQKEMPQLDPSSIFSMFSFFSQVLNPPKKTESKSPKVAVLYASGGISSGKAPAPSLFGTSEGIYSDDLCKTIRELREDDTVKAVVLRIDSPGGSALASDVIHRELELLKAKKPIIASMSDVAASGGYYIAAPCDLILAEELTITGSIGVLGGKMVIGKVLENIGIRTETLTRGKYMELFSTVRKWNEEEREIIDGFMSKTYDEFVNVVAKGRKMSAYDIHKVAQGRVWTGKAALQVGLVDQIGGLVDAIQEAQKSAKLTDQKYEVVPYPKMRSIFDLFRDGFSFAQLTQEATLHMAVPEEVKPLIKRVLFLKNLTKEHLFLMLPYNIEIK